MEKLTWEIWKQKDMGKALLIGGLLAYVPVLNLLLMGYMGRWVRQLVRSEGIQLPEWSDGKALLDELLKVFVPMLVWGFIPFLLAGLLFTAISQFLFFLHLGFFAITVALLPLSLVSLLSPAAVTVSLIRLYTTDQLQESLAIADVLQAVFSKFRQALFPILQFYGILILGWPLIGFASFLASLPLFAQLILIYRTEEEGLKSVAN